MKSDSVVEFGRRLRDLRKQNDWPIAEVSRRTGLALSTISKVENGLMSLTYDKLLQLAEGLSIDIADLFRPAAFKRGAVVMGRRSIDRPTEGTHITVGGYHYWYLNTDMADKMMTPILGRTDVRSLKEFGELIKHAGEEFILVLEGAIEVHTEFYKPVLLGVGECVYIDSNMGHAYISASPSPCRFICVCAGDTTERTLENVAVSKASTPHTVSLPSSRDRKRTSKDSGKKPKPPRRK